MPHEQPAEREKQHQIEQLRHQQEAQREKQRQETYRRLAEQRMAQINAAAQEISPEHAKKLIGAVSSLEGGVNEQLAAEQLHDMGYKLIPVEPRKQGVDVFARDTSGKLALVEVKTAKQDIYAEDVKGQLKNTNQGRQSSDQWVRAKIVEMVKDTDTRRRDLAEEMHTNPERVQVLCMTVNIKSGEVKLFERVSADASRWKEIDRRVLPRLLEGD
jgi:hypothetical protein